MDGRDRARLQRLRGTRWDEADARWVIGLAEAEGAALHHLAREHGLDPQRLYWWRRRLASALAGSTDQMIGRTGALF